MKTRPRGVDDAGDNLARIWRASVDAVARKRGFGGDRNGDGERAPEKTTGAPSARQVIPTDLN